MTPESSWLEKASFDASVQSVHYDTVLLAYSLNCDAVWILVQQCLQQARCRPRIPSSYTVQGRWRRMAPRAQAEQALATKSAAASWGGLAASSGAARRSLGFNLTTAAPGGDFNTSLSMPPSDGLPRGR